MYSCFQTLETFKLSISIVLRHCKIPFWVGSSEFKGNPVVVMHAHELHVLVLQSCTDLILVSVSILNGTKLDSVLPRSLFDQCGPKEKLDLMNKLLSLRL